MSKKYDADVIVAGAGPAGATAAMRLAAAGVRVLVVERSPLPRQKPCGGGISTRVLSRFPWLPESLRDIPHLPVSNLYLEGPSRNVFRMQASGPAVILIRRIEFDYMLIARARDAGATILAPAAVASASQDDEGVTLRLRDGSELRARMVVAADGVNGVIARRLGMNAGWAPADLALDMMEETPIGDLRAAEPETLSVFYGYGGAHGYAYIFPKRGHVNVGVGYVLPYFKERIGVTPYDLQRQFIGDLKARGLMNGESQRAHFTPHHIPIGGPLRTTAKGRVVLAGDAGGFVNGFSAEGIYYAMVSGELAADAIVQARAGADFAAARARRAYVRAWRHEIGGELRDSVLIQKYLLHSPPRMDRVVRGAIRRPEFSAILVDYASGRTSYRAARRKLLWHFPKLLPQLAWQALRGRRSDIIREPQHG
jgi:geranylgeranyl reductase family protein